MCEKNEPWVLMTKGGRGGEGRGGGELYWRCVFGPDMRDERATESESTVFASSRAGLVLGWRCMRKCYSAFALKRTNRSVASSRYEKNCWKGRPRWR